MSSKVEEELMKQREKLKNLEKSLTIPRVTRMSFLEERDIEAERFKISNKIKELEEKMKGGAWAVSAKKPAKKRSPKKMSAKKLAKKRSPKKMSAKIPAKKRSSKKTSATKKRSIKK